MNFWLDILGMATVMALVVFIFSCLLEVVSGSLYLYLVLLFFQVKHSLTYNTVIIFHAIQQSDSVICIKHTLFFTFKNISNLGHIIRIHKRRTRT